MIESALQITESADRVVVTQPARGSLAIQGKRCLQAFVALCGWPRWFCYRIAAAVAGRRAFQAASESISRRPGMRGVFARQAFYRRALEHCGQDCYFGFLSVFSMKEARVGDRVYIGRFCSIGFADIGDEAMLADGVQVLSGGREHATRGDDQTPMQNQAQQYRRLTIGRGAWIGAGAVIMADVGEHAVVGAQALVREAVPAGCTAVGVPARIVKGPSGAKPE